MIMPGVTIGMNSIVGACSVVTKSIPPNTVVAGNPAKVICSFDSYMLKNKETMISAYIFDESYTFRNGNMKRELKEEMIRKLKDNHGFVR